MGKNRTHEANCPATERNREKEIFEAALDVSPPTGRRAFIEQACAGDVALVRRVMALIEASESATLFLSGTPDPTSFIPETTSILEGPGTVIGRYKLLEQIGEGGFGVVYMAEQFEPVRRKVALKIIKPGMDTRQVIGRFEAERQALALMDDPNIARIYDAGATETGRPYFVMELVKGIPITRFCDEQKLNTENRLKLLIEVCSAVQHAHQKGVIHRDLKPSNVLITLHAGRPVPKIIDFGIAKAMEEPLTDKTVFTRFQQFLGTPAYMSPEQMALSGLQIDTRSDIYSLGVLLYELLTGGPPFDTSELLSGDLDDMRRIIREREPVRPSTRVSQLHSGNVQRSTPHPQPSALPSDLDWIVLKAIDKDPDRRYATANELAADIRRYLTDEPVTAVAPTLAYQLRKFYRRNRTFVATTLISIASLVVATAISIGYAMRTQEAEKQALRDAATAEQVSDFLWRGLMKQLSPWTGGDGSVRLRDALDVAAGQVANRLGDDPLAEASVRMALGNAYTSLSELPVAESNLVRAVELRREWLGEWDERTAEALFKLGGLRNFQGRTEEAEALFDQVVRIRERVLGEHHPDTLTAKASATFNQVRQDTPMQAREKLEQLLSVLQRYLGDNADIVGTTMNQLGMACLGMDDLERAGQLFDGSYHLAVRNSGERSAAAMWSLSLVASTRARQGRFDVAEATFDRVIATQEQINGPEHVVTRDTKLTLVTAVLIPQRRFDEAAEVFTRVAAVEQSRLGYLRPTTMHAMSKVVAASATPDGSAALKKLESFIETYRQSASAVADGL